MERERLDKIEFGHEYMDANLLTLIEKFKSFESNIKPVVTVLCSDNRLLMQMNKLTDNSGDVNFHVCGTFNGIDDAIENIQFSDAVIVNTLALKISPDGLYKVLKSVEELGKDVYFILSGWESLPKNIDLCKKKLSQIDIEFPFIKIKASQNVFVKNIEGFSFVEDVMKDFTKRICDSFNFIHTVQIESLYKRIRRDVKKFRENICIEIQKEQSLVLQLHQNIIAKQRRYEITFSHATVGLNDTLERLEKTVKNIDIDEVLCCLETEDMSARERYLDNQNKIEREVKGNLYNLILSKIESFNFSALSKSSLSSKNDLQIDEAMNDLLANVEMLKSCRFIENLELEELEHKVRETNALFSNAREYDNSVSLILDKVKESLRAKITGFQFEKLAQNEIQKFFNSALSKASNLIDKMNSADECNYEFQDDNGANNRYSCNNEDELNENDKLRKAEWNHFCLEIERLIEYSKNALSVLISDNCKIVNEEIDVQSKNSVENYFSFIIKSLNGISEKLIKKLTEFGRTDL